LLSRNQNLSVLLLLGVCIVNALWFHHVWPSTCIYQLSSHCTDFCEAGYWKHLLQSVKKIYICFKSDNNTRYLHGDLSVFPIVDSSMCSSTLLRTTILNNGLLHHHGDAFSIYIVDSDTCILTAPFCSVLFSIYC